MISKAAFLAFALTLLAWPAAVRAQGTDPAINIGERDLGGTVTGPNGPEAGVWVIAETTDLPTQLAKVVVTDERGRYLVPDLPKANYRVWVRGYGLVDSPKVTATPGRILNLTAVAAPNEAAAAQYYPPIYWFSLLRVPEKSEFPLPKMKSQGAWLNTVKTGACGSCHALGTPGTRTLSEAFGEFKNSADAWARRLQSGGAQMFMARDIGRLDTDRALKLFGEWTDRIAAGELPFAKPERPQGIERNVVVTMWDWGHPTSYLHDAVSTDRRNPRLNANGSIYGSPEDSTEQMPILDQKTFTASAELHPGRDAATPTSRPHQL